MLSDGSDLTRAANAFHVLAVATGKARSPSVEPLRLYQQGDSVIRPRVSSNVAARGVTDGLSQVCWFSLMQTVVHQHAQPEIDSFRHLQPV